MSNTMRFVLFAVSMFLVTSSVHASGQSPFDASAFKAAQAAGQPILVEIHADWCPTCRAQIPILNKLSGESKYSKIIRFRVDFDTQKDIVKNFNARMQSTLVLYKGQKEVARSVGVTDARVIQSMLDKAL